MRVDLRSDTVTRPTAGMRAAMAAADVGDDVFRDDPTVLELEERVAALLGKEAALFVPSGTMANQIAVRVHCAPGTELICHAGAHVFNYEGGGAALAGVQVRPIDSADGLLPVAALDRAYHDDSDTHLAPTACVALENTHNGCGGVVLDPAGVAAVADWAQRKHVALHLDGARLWNAAVASGAAPDALAAPFHTVSVCFSKGLGAPAGSALAGSRAAIKKALRVRKAMGGAMRQAGILAAAALHALDYHVDRLAQDHRRAKALAAALAATPGLTCDLDRVQTNLVYFGVAPGHPLGALDERGRPAIVAQLAERGVLITGSAARLRAVLHLDVDDAGLAHTVAALETLG